MTSKTMTEFLRATADERCDLVDILSRKLTNDRLLDSTIIYCELENNCMHLAIGGDTKAAVTALCLALDSLIREADIPYSRAVAALDSVHKLNNVNEETEES